MVGLPLQLAFTQTQILHQVLGSWLTLSYQELVECEALECVGVRAP